MALRSIVSASVLVGALAACGRLGYDPLGLEPDGDGGAADTSAPVDAGLDALGDDAGLPAGCLVVTTPVDEDDAAESATPPHQGAGLSLREAIALADAASGRGCIGFLAPMTLAWAANAPAIDDALDLHGAGSVLVDGANVATGLTIAVGAVGTTLRDLTVDGFDVGLLVRAPDVTIGPGVVVRDSNVGVRLLGAGARVSGARVLGSSGAAIDVQADGATIELTVAAGSGGASIDTRAGIDGLTIRHVTLHGGAVGCNLRTNPIGVVIRNAIITETSGPGIDVSGGTQLEVDHVAYSGPQIGCSGCALGAGSILADPRYVDAAALDFRLAADSPAIDVGADTGLDVNGALAGRFGGVAPDLGAHER